MSISFKIQFNGLLGLLTVLLVSHQGHSQKKLTDSLESKKALYETQLGFFPTDTSYIKVLYELSRSYIYQIPDSTKSISDRVLELSKKAGFEKGLAGGHLGLGVYYNLTGDFEEAQQHLNVAEKKATTIEDDRLLLKTINAKALGQFMEGNYPEAYAECKKGENQAIRAGDLEMQVFFTMNLATCFAILRDYKQALPYFRQALKIVKKTNNKLQKAQIESNLGFMYLHTNDLQEAKKYSLKAIKTLDKEQFQAWESFAWATLGEVATKEKKYDIALQYFSKSDSLLMNIQDMQRKAETSLGMANVYFFKEDFAQSLKYAKTAEEISKNISYHQGVVESSELLSKLFTNDNQHQKALEYLSTVKHLSDSILESENRTKFLMLEAQAKFDREKKLADFENEKKLVKQKTITYVSVVFLIALLIIILLIRRNAINQKKANLSLKELNNTKDKLFSIIGHDLKAPINTLQELLSLYTSKEISEEDVVKLAPQLKQNVDHSSFTLNNLLFWAKTQMNGLSPEPKQVLIKKKAHSIWNTYKEIIKSKEIEMLCHIDEEEA